MVVEECGQRSRAGRLCQQVLPFEQKPYRTKHLGVLDQHHLVDIAPRQREGQLPRRGGGQPVGDRGDLVQRDDAFRPRLWVRRRSP